MNSWRNFERVLYRPESNAHCFYPEVDHVMFAYMDIESASNSSTVMCFPYYIHLGEKTYIAIYIWDVMLPEGYKRFVLESGYSLSADDEELFLTYLFGDIQIDCVLYKRLVGKVRNDYPDIHLIAYKDNRHTLLHLYYTLHQTGPYEILYKANLNYLATGLREMNEYNLIGSSPQKIFDVQLGMLRALNSDEGIKLLGSTENRKIANNLYARYHNIIRGKQINVYQWRYMKEQEICGGNIDKQMFTYFGRMTSDKQYYSYLKYLEKKNIVDEYYSLLPMYPDKKEMELNFQVCDMIEWYIEHERIIDDKLRKRAKDYQSIYAYETSDYIIIVPSSLRELLTEAQNQHNCLYRHVLRDSVILFMREKNNMSQSLITIEVAGDMILQALGAYNCMPDEKQKNFLDEYATSKKFKLLSDELFDWEDDEYWYDEEE